MSRYIDAEELKHIVNSSKYYGTERQRDFCDMITETPAADVEPVRHGKPKVVKRKQWVDDYKNLDGTLFECFKVLVEYEEEFCPFCGKALGDFNSYCGNCGAKMNKEQEHE